MAGMFNRGFNAVNEEKQRQEEQKSRGAGIFRFFLSKDKEEAPITFLTEQPVNYYEHTLKKFVNGKERYESVPCVGEGCKHCADGDRPSFKSAWLIIDHREVKYTDKDNKTKVLQDQVRLLIYGTKIASQLDRKSDRYGLTGREYTVVRLGTGTSTSYVFEHGDKYELTTAQIKEVLPDSIKESYDGSMESLYSIIEAQLLALAGETPEGKPSTQAPVDESLVGTEEETPQAPPRRGIPRRNRAENSIKAILKRKR